MLPFTPPAGPDVLFYRGNFGGVRVPGVPLLPGMAGFTLSPQPNPPLVMSLDIFRYPKPEQNMVLDQHAMDGYTHFQCSVGHAVGLGWSIDQYIDFSGRVKQRVGYADHWFMGGGPWVWDAGDPSTNVNRDRDRAYWAAIFDPWIDALLANGLIDAACPGWQFDGMNQPGDKSIGVFQYFADRLGPRHIALGSHWMNEAGGWWSSDPALRTQYPWVVDRFTWWQAMRNILVWFHHQGPTHYQPGNRPFNQVTDWGVPEYQAKLCDTMNPFGDGRMGTSGLFGDRPYSLVIYENSAQAQFNDPVGVGEDVSDARSYLLCCTKAKTFVGGYGNGGRRPDGTAL